MSKLSMDTITVKRVVKHIPILVEDELVVAPTPFTQSLIEGMGMWIEWRDIKGTNTPFLIGWLRGEDKIT